jgi:heat shock factor-binding protein 1
LVWLVGWSLFRVVSCVLQEAQDVARYLDGVGVCVCVVTKSVLQRAPPCPLGSHGRAVTAYNPTFVHALSPFLRCTQGLGGDDETEDLTVFVQGLLQQMQTRFQQMSDTIIGRIDEMGTRIDDLEKSIADLMEQAGVEDGKGS